MKAAGIDVVRNVIDYILEMCRLTNLGSAREKEPIA